MTNTCEMCGQEISSELAEKVKIKQQAHIQEETQKLTIKLDEEYKEKINQLKEEKQSEINEEKTKLEEEQEAKIKDKVFEIEEQAARDKAEIEENAKAKFDEKQKEAQELEIKNKRALKEIEDAKDELDAVKKKLQTKQADITGQIGQDEFVKLLRESFPNDSFKPTSGGIEEADIIHTIRENGIEYGNLICYDVKKDKTPNTKDIEQAKTYREIHGTFFSIIITTSMPVREIPNKFIGRKNNILIIHPKISIEVIKIIRHSLIMIEQSKNSVQDRDSKQAKLFDYILGQDFQARISSLFYSIQKFKKVLDTEEKQFNKAKKEKLKIIKELNSSLKITNEISNIIEEEIKIKSIELELEQIESD